MKSLPDRIKTCTANLYMSGKNVFPPGKELSQAVFRIDEAESYDIFDSRDGISILSGHKHGGRQFVNGGASFAGGNHMPLYMTTIRAVDIGLTGGAVSASWMHEPEKPDAGRGRHG